MPSSSPTSECHGPSLPLALALLLRRNEVKDSHKKFNEMTLNNSLVTRTPHTRAHTLKQAHETMWSSLGFYLVEKRHFGMDDLHSVLFSFLWEMLAGCLCLSFHDFVSCSLFLVCFAKQRQTLFFIDTWFHFWSECHAHSQRSFWSCLSVSKECRWWIKAKLSDVDKLTECLEMNCLVRGDQTLSHRQFNWKKKLNFLRIST